MFFGISTHLYHDEPLRRDHLLEIAAHGFETIELFATRSHVDYHDPRVVADLARWLSDAKLSLHSIHAPIAESLRGGVWGPAYSNASRLEERRQAAVAEAVAALGVARQIPVRVLVTHLGVPAPYGASGDNDPPASRRSLEEIQAAAERVGVRVAAEVIPNDLSAAARLVGLLEQDDEPSLRNVGICLDFGHAHLMGDLLDAIELTAGHLFTTHVHDNRGRTDEHLLPFVGTIDWAAALTSLCKVGYEGALMFELANTSTPAEVLVGAAAVRRRFEAILVSAASGAANGPAEGP